ncbi:MAG: L-threonylcarbamoyladenylate synthase [bacterium]
MKTRLLQPSNGLSETVTLLDEGFPVALPTETVYGLAANALSAEACARVFEAKDRPLTDPLIVHLPSMDWLPRVAVPCPLTLALAENFWPGPLTLVLPKTANIPEIVTAGQETVAVRMSAHPVFQEVVQTFGKPLAAPSANRFGRISPTSAGHVLSELDGRIKIILDGGPCPHGIESTIVHVFDDRLQILRAGPVTEEELRGFAPVFHGPAGVTAPGGLKSHYAPRTKLVIEENPKPRGPRNGLLSWSHTGEGFFQTEFLSSSGDLREAAANLYGAMRRLDEAGLDLLIAEAVPEAGIGRAIMDRLRKAAAE